MSGIIGIVGLVGANLGHAEVASTEVRIPFLESCRQLADLAAFSWAGVERSVKISCLDAGVIPVERYDGMVRGFLHECTHTVARKMGARPAGSGARDVRIPGQELTLMFIRHYNPLFVEYCSSRNPGKGLNTRPAGLTEA